MPQLSFTARLMLAMMLTVTFATSGVLWLMRGRVETSYLRLFEERFRSQIEMFNGLQTVRLESIRARCRVLANSATVVQALQLGSGDLPDAMLLELQSSARGVRDSAVSFDARVPAPDAAVKTRTVVNQTADKSPSEPRRRQYRPGTPDVVDLALVSSLGRVYSIKSGGDGRNAVRWLEDDRIALVPSDQQTGYLLAETPFRFRMPREVILTPVRDPGTQEILGALAVGLPLSDYGENMLYDLSRPGKPGAISTGLWLEDQLFSRTVPLSEQESLKVQLRGAIRKQGPDATAAALSVRVELSGEPYQMLLRPLSTDSALPQAWGVMLSSLAAMTAEQRTLRNEVLAIAGMAFAAALVLSYFLARSLMHPVRDLVQGTQRIRQGKYDTRVQVARRDELGVLGESFNEMAGGLQQREIYHSILVQLTDFEVAQRLIASPSLGGERREVTVLFCDIRGFTAVTDGMMPEDVIAMLNEHMTAMTESVHRHRGVVDKFVGDLIMAVFGAPESSGDDAGNAARCALEMMETRRRLNTVTGFPVLEIGIGIASGPAVAGCMGSQNRLNYTVLGERVNLASRLCAAAPVGEILLDAATTELLGNAFSGELLPEQSFKGISRPVRPFRLVKAA